MKTWGLVALAFLCVLSMIAIGRPITYQITPSQCWQCGRCVFACPAQAFYYDEELQSLQIDQSLCNGDGNCVNWCPHGAIHQVVGNSEDTASGQRTLFCYPNPMVSELNIKYSLPKGTSGRIEIFNIRGQVIQSYDATAQHIENLLWNGKDDRGNPVAQGKYCIRLRYGTDVKTMMITKVRGL